MTLGETGLLVWGWDVDGKLVLRLWDGTQRVETRLTRAEAERMAAELGAFVQRRAEKPKP